MKEYHKIPTVFKRDPDTKFKTLLDGVFATPELEYLAMNEWTFTEKVDGTNIRVMFDDTAEMITFGGKSERAQIPARLLNALDALFLPKLETFKTICSGPTCLYGEGYGAKIQKAGGNYRQDQGFVLFDVKVGAWWLQSPDVCDVAEILGLDIVPAVGSGTLFELVDRTRRGFTSIWGNFQAEGLVARPKTELKTRSGHRIITKIKHKDFQVNA